VRIIGVATFMVALVSALYLSDKQIQDYQYNQACE